MIKKCFGELSRAIAPVAVLMFVAGSGTALAEELAEGTVINAANLADVLDDTFEGHAIGDMLPEQLQMWIRDHALVMPLQHSRPLAMTEGLKAATAKYAGTATFDPVAKQLNNWVAGTPFAPHSEISLDDPDAGYKLVWNFFISPGYRSDAIRSEAPAFLIDGRKGIQQSQEVINNMLVMKGRTSGGPADLAPDDPALYQKNMFIVIKPYDIAGLGSYSERFFDGRQDNAWAYLKSVRRTRRISGNVWADPLANTDLIGDDNGMLNAHPSWYENVRLTGRRYLLSAMHSGSFVTEDNAAERIDQKNPPFWNPIGIGYEPREVYEVEVTYPEIHPYSRKTVYIETQLPIAAYSEMYDRKGDFWKTYTFAVNEVKAENGEQALLASHVLMVDWQNLHATLFYINLFKANYPFDPNDFNERAIERAAKGQLQF